MCKNYFINNCGQGFTAPCCALGNKIFECKLGWENAVYLTFVNCEGDFNKCDVVADCILEFGNEI